VTRLILHFSAFMNKEKRKIVRDDDAYEGGSSSGSITLSVEQYNAYLLACFTKERRQGQKKFGLSPFTEDPNLLLGGKGAARSGANCGDQPHPHPMLAHSQQFSGDDPKITANPVDNPDARKAYPELRNENQLRKNPGFRQRKSIRLSR